MFSLTVGGLVAAGSLVGIGFASKTWRERLVDSYLFRPRVPRRLNVRDGFEKCGKYHYWIDRPRQATNLIIVYLHGNAESIEDSREYLSRLSSRAILLAPEYTGYAWTDYARIQPSVRDTKTACLAILKKIRTKRESVILIGRSIGTGFACWLANQLPAGVVTAVILLSPFTSISDLARNLVPCSCASSSLISERLLNNECELKRIAHTTAILILHGEDDDIVPARHSRKLYKSLLSQHHPDVQLVIRPGEHHNNLQSLPIVSDLIHNLQ